MLLSGCIRRFQFEPKRAPAAGFRVESNLSTHALDRFSRLYPLDMTHIPAMALRYDPVFRSLVGDPRFAVIEERVRVAVNAERAKAGLAPISKQAWISDPKTLLTKN